MGLARLATYLGLNLSYPLQYRRHCSVLPHGVGVARGCGCVQFACCLLTAMVGPPLVSADVSVYWLVLLQSKRRGLSLEEKRQRLLDLFFEKVC